jgi:hypothetical protein
MFENRNKDLRTTLCNKARDVIKSDRFRSLRALQMSSSEVGANDKNSEDCEQ